MLIELERQDDVCVLRLRGRFVTGTNPNYLRDKTDEVKSQNCKKVLADLRELLSIGSTGIGFLVDIYTFVTKNASGRFVLVAPQPHVREVFELTHLDSVIPLVTDIASGLAVLRDEGTAARGAVKG
jgi:anti-anti-sigma factor